MATNRAVIDKDEVVRTSVMLGHDEVSSNLLYL